MLAMRSVACVVAVALLLVGVQSVSGKSFDGAAVRDLSQDDKLPLIGEAIGGGADCKRRRRCENPWRINEHGCGGGDRNLAANRIQGHCHDIRGRKRSRDWNVR